MGEAAEKMDPSARSAASPAGTLVERLRSVHLKMVDAVLGGDGLQQVAALAAEAAGAPVAIVVPRLDAAVAAGVGAEDAVVRDHVLEDVRRYVSDRVRDRPSPVPEALVAEAPIQSGDDVVGAVVLLRGAGSGPDAEPAPEAGDFLHLAAVACLTEVAVEEAKEEVEQNLRGSFLEDLRSRPDLEPREVVRRAARLGCDLSRGAVVLCAELTTDRPRHVIATITGDEPGSLAEHLDGRVYAILPGTGGDDAPDTTTARGRALATRLRRHGTVGVSSFYSDPAELPRAIQEAELVLDVLKQGEGGGWDGVQDIGTGTYRLLFRVLASHPEEVRSFYEDTVAPIVRYDDQYRTDLVGTLEAYLEQNCNMNATASAIYAHRHTVAYRLERVKELTGLDPMLSEDRERLGLGLKAYRIIAPRLPK
jgi:sugar diacid utilization regulator